MKHYIRDGISKVPASLQQEGIWFHAITTGAAYWNFTQEKTYRGVLQEAAFTQAMEEMLRRHTALRTVFRIYEDRLCQVVLGDLPIAEVLEYIHVTDSNAEAFVQEVRATAIAAEAYPFNLEEECLVRLKVLISGDKICFLLTMHHIITDSVSMQVFWKDLIGYYNILLGGTGIPLHPACSQYIDYTWEQQAFAITEAYHVQKKYWLDKLSGELPDLNLSYYQDISSWSICHSEIMLPAQLVQDAKSFSMRKRVLYSAIFQLAYYILLYKYSGNTTVLIGNTVNGRGLAGKKYPDTIGLFAKRLINKLELHGGNTLLELLNKVNTDLLESFENGDIVYEELLRELNEKNKTGLKPLFQAVFNMIKGGNREISPAGLEPYEELALEHSQVGDIEYDMGLSVMEQFANVSVRIDLKCEQIFGPVVKDMAACYLDILSACIYRPEMQLSALNILTEEAHDVLSVFSTGAAIAVTSETVVDLFVKQAAMVPDRMALVCGGQQLTYGQLDRQSDLLAHYLRGKGLEREGLVAICIERSPQMMVAILGVLKAGGAYVPMEVSYPPERIRYILSDTAAQVLLSSRSAAAGLPTDYQGSLVLLDDDWAEIVAATPLESPISLAAPAQLAYVLYTSGSTGQPKGTLIKHQNIVALLAGFQQVAPPEQELAGASVCPYVFDVSVWEFFINLCYGNTLHILDGAHVFDPAYIADYFIRQAITTAYIPPTILGEVAVGLSSHSDTAALQRLLVGVLPIRGSVLDTYCKAIPGLRIVNGYGPTETTICATFHCYQPGSYENHVVPIGRPVAGYQVYLLDREGSPVPVGVPGEICIAGRGVGAGYLHNTILTEEKFIRNPFGEGTLYRTGDIARWLPDGNILYMKRMDEQLKIRGYRIEPGEIEHCLCTVPGVQHAVVVAANNKQSEQVKLLAYLQVDETFLTAGEISYTDFLISVREHLQKRLPDYMMPSVVTLLDQFPLTASGKVDKKALPPPDTAHAAALAYIAPRNEMERRIAAIWAELLEVEKVGVQDHFFRLGGHSLLAMRAIALINQQLSYALHINVLFSYPILEQLAAFLQTQQSVFLRPIIRAVKTGQDKIPLSFAQEWLWVTDRLEGSQHYHVPWVLQMSGPLQVAALTHALRGIISRHEILRTVLKEDETGECTQHILPSDDWQMQYLHHSHYAIGSAELRALLVELVDTPFDLSRDYMLRATLIQLAADRFLFVMNLHHIAIDGWSWSILVRELTALYAAALESREALLPSLPVQYADYALWQRQYLEGSVFFEEQLAYWKEKLTGVTPLSLPTGIRPAVQRMAGSSLYLPIAKDVVAGLSAYAEQAGVTLFMMLLTAFKVTLYRHSGEADICVGTPIAGRTQSETAGLIGCFINTLALRSDLSGNPPFSELLQSVRHTLLDAYSYQDVPFEKVVDVVAGERDLSSHPIFQVMFVMNTTPEVELQLAQIQLSPYEAAAVSRTKFDLTITMVTDAQGLGCHVEYAHTLYKEADIQQLFAHYGTLLSAIIADPDERIDHLQMMTEAEGQEILSVFSTGAAIAVTSETVVDLFVKQAAMVPDRTALVCGGQQLAYGQLDRQSDLLAHYLRGKGLEREGLVAICIERSPQMMVAILGVLKAGGAYVPMEVSYPPERIRYILSDTAAQVLLSSRSAAAGLPTDYQGSVVLLDDDWAEIVAATPLESPISLAAPAQLAYVLYTSGSTGQPKGTLIKHQNIVALLAGFQQVAPPEQELAGASVCPYVFDVSVWEFFINLCYGNTLHILDGAHVFDPAYIADYFIRQAITTAYIPPTILGEVAAGLSSHSDTAALQRLLVGVLPIRGGVLDTYCKAIPGLRIVNGYGPTETTVCATFHCYQPGSYENHVVPIGRPVAGYQVYLLDREGSPVPVGVPGEICIAGRGVGAGYLHNTILTEEKFINNPFGEGPLYRTGDIARWLPDGHILYMKRRDEQLKIRGYRIEPGEIEHAIQQSGQVIQNVVTAREDKNGNRQLVAYVIAPAFDRQAIMEYLRGHLPEYMVPGIWVQVDMIPLTPGGKVDRAKLPAFDAATLSGPGYVAPRSEAEVVLARVWEDLLGIKQIGIYENFFWLGGDSIIAIQVVSRMKRMRYELRPRDVFQYQTIVRLATLLLSRSAATLDTAAQGRLEGACGLLPIQHWFLQKEMQGEDISHFNQSLLLNIDKGISSAALATVISALVSAHDALRFCYDCQASGWEQTYGDHVEVLITHDLTNELPATLPAAITAAASFYQQRLAIDKGVLVQAVLLQTPSSVQYNRFLLVIHHLAVDGVSWRILQEDLEWLLTALQEGRPLVPGRKTSAYRDWYQALMAYGDSRQAQSQLSYWSEVAGSGARLPVDRHDSRVSTMKDMETITTRLLATQTQLLLQKVPLSYQIGINDILLAALTGAIAVWAGDLQLVIGLEGHGRQEELGEHIDLSRTVGWFTSMYPLLLESKTGMTPADLIRGTRERLRRVPNKGIGFGVLKYLQQAAVLAGPEPWELSFNYLGQFDTSGQSMRWCGPAVEPAGKNSGDAVKVPEKISINCLVSGETLQLHWSFSKLYFSAATIHALSTIYMEQLEMLIEHCMSQIEGGRMIVSLDEGLEGFVSYQEVDRFVNRQMEERAATVTALYPLSGLQQGLLFHSLYDKKVKAYIQQVIYDLPDCELGVLISSWEYLIRQHTILRTGITHADFQLPVQYVLQEQGLPLKILDYRQLSATAREEALEICAMTDRQETFDFTQPPLMRLTLIRLGDRSYRMIWSMHHILLDGWSMEVLTGNLKAIYYKLISGDEAALMQQREDNFGDYIKLVGSRDLTGEENYWRNYLADIKGCCCLPFAQSGAESTKGIGHYDQESLYLDQALTAGIQRFATRERLTVNTLMQGVWAYLLYCYTGCQDVMFGVTVSDRPGELDDIENRVGLYINTLPLRARVALRVPVAEWLRSLQTEQANSRQYEQASLTDIRQWAGVATALIDHVLLFENFPVNKDGAGLAGQLHMHRVFMHEYTNYPLNITIGGGQEIWIGFTYNTRLLEASVIRQLAMAFEQVIRQLITGAVATLEDIQLDTGISRPQVYSHQEGIATPVYIAPRNETEQLLADIWQQLLQKPRIGVKDHFFFSGGHSVMAIRMAWHIRQLWQLEVPLPVIFLHTDIAGLAAYIDDIKKNNTVTNKNMYHPKTTAL